MSNFQTPKTISQIIGEINSNRILLPAFQREYVWSAPQVEALFDSVMRNYPISSMLFWKVKNEAKHKYKFYQILRYYRERYHTHNDVFNTNHVNDFHAVLDGQQRLTSLYIGLCGSYAYKKNRAWWQDTESNLPTRHLYLNLSRTLNPEQSDAMYEFLFLDKAQTNERELYEDSNRNKWFKVSVIISLYNALGERDIDEFADDYNLTKDEKKILRRLERQINNADLINYYEEDTSNPDEAVNIFVRINSGGTPLTMSAILMSMLTASWKTKDARTEINNLVDAVKNLGFNITQDYVMKALLVLFHNDVRFRLKNFSNKFIEQTEENWEKVRDCILSLFNLLKRFGFIGNTLTSYNATMPILFYLYYSEKYTGIYEQIALKQDRERIRVWLLKAILLKVFGGSSDSAISKGRKSMLDKADEDGLITGKSFNNFPADLISADLSMTSITEEEMEEILMAQKDSSYSFAVLAILFPHLDYSNKFHMDHMHPMAAWDANDHSREIHNSILNLQMIDGNENMSKNAGPLEDWVDAQVAAGVPADQFYANHLIPQGVSLKIDNFNEFVKARREIIINKLNAILKS